MWVVDSKVAIDLGEFEGSVTSSRVPGLYRSGRTPKKIPKYGLNIALLDDPRYFPRVPDPKTKGYNPKP